MSGKKILIDTSVWNGFYIFSLDEHFKDIQKSVDIDLI